MPRSRQAAATSSVSVATTTGSMRPLDRAARHTHSTIGRPAIGRSTLRGRRVEWSRAGITPAIRTVLMQPSLQEPRHLLPVSNTLASKGLTATSAAPYHRSGNTRVDPACPSDPRALHSGGVAQMVRAWDS